MSVPIAPAVSSQFAVTPPRAERAERKARNAGFALAAGMALRACGTPGQRKRTACMLAFAALVDDGALAGHAGEERGWVARDLLDALYVAYDDGPREDVS